MRFSTSIALVAMLAMASADVYFHSPRGVNDRCDEKSNDRNNEERLYNSEDNSAGGYGWCDQEMFYYVDTSLHIEWYSQHSCGNGAANKDDLNNPEIDSCEQIIQIGCQDSFQLFAGPNTTTYYLTDGTSLGRPGADNPAELTNNPLDVYNTFGDTCTERHPTTLTGANNLKPDCPNGFYDIATCDNLKLSDGTGTFNSATCQCSTRKAKTYALHEPEAYWQQCRARQRNQNLFIADQNPDPTGGATKTRQQPNSARYGFECVEERDYYPYWHPSPWKDLAVFTSNTSMCNFYQTESQNVKDKCLCVATDEAGASWTQNLTAWKYNNELDCKNSNFNWRCFGNWNWPAPQCIQAANQADNRLGNVNSLGDANGQVKDNALAHFDWQIPASAIPNGQDSIRCVLRIRYNISNGDIGFFFDAKDNSKSKTNPIQTYGNPLSPEDSVAATQDISTVMPIRMAINTAQYGRTFEDRTQTFQIRKRPDNLNGATIHNLNVRGKRGNIAQVRNCVEYDFVPNQLQANVGDYVHVQFCGTDYNNNGNAGEGRAGTDRSNIVEVVNFANNLPLPLNQSTGIFSAADLSAMTWLGQLQANCYTISQMLDKTQKGNSNNDPQSCHFLNGVRDANGFPTAYFSYIAQVQNSGVFKYMSSRNNNFSNRSQKGIIQASTGINNPAAIAGIVIGCVAGVALIAGGVFLVATQRITFGKFSNRV